MLSGRSRAKAFRDKISQDCPDCNNRVLAIRINGFYAGSRDRIFLWECPICEAVWKKTRPKLLRELSDDVEV